ncbi:hypothetical protein M951_chr353 (nucleomorph) [Lotharella oceanica]|uniref:Uncharacterized protein n=1 Tax=Lotharella oceanica TaxID=641309 RepID=A0A060DHG9_9EUKA|nr:hypothetical protein M951_chr353 [Lotharella oceanica]
MHSNILTQHNIRNVKKLLFVYILSYKKYIENFIKLKYNFILPINNTIVSCQKNYTDACLLHKTLIIHYDLIIFQTLSEFIVNIFPSYKLKKYLLFNNYILNHIFRQYDNYILFINSNTIILKNIDLTIHLILFFIIYSSSILFFINNFIILKEFCLLCNLYYIFFYFFQVRK